MEKKFKPFQKVLIRRSWLKEWMCDFYSHHNELYHSTLTLHQVDDNNILPYEGNEHLVGTTDSPDEEVRLEEGELIIVFDDYQKLFDNISCVRKFIRVLNTVFETNAANWDYAIRFSDFNPNDMKATKAKILCVKNGKIIKYKN